MRLPGIGSFRQLVVCPLSGPFNVVPSNEVSETLCCRDLFAGPPPAPALYEGESAWLCLLFLQPQRTPLGAEPPLS